MILKSGVSVWDAVDAIEVSSAAMFIGVACTFGLACELAALMRADEQGGVVDKAVFLTHALTSLAFTVAAQACTLALSDGLPSPWAFVPEKQTLLDSISGSVYGASAGLGVTLLANWILCALYGETVWIFDLSYAQMTATFALVTLPLEEIGLRNYLYVRLKQVLTPAAASLVVGALAAALQVPLYFYFPPYLSAAPRYAPLAYGLLGNISLSLLAGMVHDAFGGALLPVVAFRAAHSTAMSALGLANIGSYMLVFGQVGLVAFFLLRVTLFAPPAASPLAPPPRAANGDKDD